MNKKILIGIVLISLAVFVVAEISDTPQLSPSGIPGTISLKKGWNLVSVYSIRNAFDETNELYFQGKDIKATFFYDRYYKRYMRIYPNREGDKLNEWFNQLGDVEKGGSIEEYGGFVNSAMWIYSSKDQTLDFKTVDGPLKVDYVGLKSGWNFLTITSEMTDKSLNDIKGNCNIISAFLWDKQNQEWGTILNLLDDKNILKNEGGLWGGFIIKVSNNCKLGSSGETTTPPELP